MRRSLLRITSLGVGIALLAGCAVHPPPTPQEIQEQTPLPGLGLEQPWRAEAQSAGEVQDDWLATFGDEQLNALVAEAIAYNPDLRVAAIQVERAEVYVRLAQAALRPSVGVFGTGGANASGGDLSSALQGLMAGVSWEPDLWGRLRYARNAAQESAASATADYEFGRQSLAATVAKAWFSATLAGLQERHTAAMADSTEDLLDFAQQRQRVGVGDEQEITTARAQLSSLEDTLQEVKLTQTQALRALELLLGRYPAAELEARADLPQLPGAVPTGMPLQILERRPDIVAAERRVAAAFNRVGEAKAARLPSIRLNLSLGVLSSDVLELKDDFENPTLGAGGRLLAPIYQGGALKTQVEIRTLEQKEAVFDYARTALRALGEVEQTLAVEASLATRAELLARVVADDERELELLNHEYRIGQGDLRAVRRQEIEVRKSQLALLAVQAAQLTGRVNLQLALGGSFETPPEPEPTETAEAG